MDCFYLGLFSGWPYVEGLGLVSLKIFVSLFLVFVVAASVLNGPLEELVDISHNVV